MRECVEKTLLGNNFYDDLFILDGDDHSYLPEIY